MVYLLVHAIKFYIQIICAPAHASTWLQIKYKRVHLESSNIYKEQLKEFHEKYPDAKELLKRYDIVVMLYTRVQ